MRKVESQGLNYNDVLLLPQFSDIKHRSDVNTMSWLCKSWMVNVPIIVANMDSVVNKEVAKAAYDAGGCAFLHRYQTPDKTTEDLKWLFDNNVFIRVPSIGVGEEQVELGLKYQANLATHINIDIAHADHAETIKTIMDLKSKGLEIPLIVGNIATKYAARRLLLAGANVVKCGIANGAVCQTKNVTGHGNAQLSTIMEMADEVHELGGYLIADGGVREIGDAVKGLAAGADLIMVGSMFSGSNEIGLNYYRGMASADAQNEFKGFAKNVEGKTITIEPKNKSVADIMNEFREGIQSGLSYSGCRTLTEFRNTVEYIVLK